MHNLENFTLSLTYRGLHMQSKSRITHLISSWWGCEKKLFSALALKTNSTNTLKHWRRENRDRTEWRVRKKEGEESGARATIMTASSPTRVDKMNSFFTPDQWRWCSFTPPPSPFTARLPALTDPIACGNQNCWAKSVLNKPIHCHFSASFVF